MIGLKHTTRVPPAVYGQAVTHTAPSRAGTVQPLLWKPLEPQSRPTAVESMSSRAGDMHECDVRRLAADCQLELLMLMLPKSITTLTRML